jgi:hypothetical protein
MARYNIHFVYTVTDINGDSAVVRVPTNVPDTITLAALVVDTLAIEALLVPLTNGKITRGGISVLQGVSAIVVGATPPNNAEYSSVTDGARLQFADVSGERTAVTIPAPLEHVFGASSNVVDSTQTDVNAFIGYVTTNSVPPSGSGSYAFYKGGIKVGKRARRRRSALVP